MRFFRLFLLALFVWGCSCDSSFRGMRIGVDPDWYDANLGAQVSYVNGFTEEVLLEISRYSGMQFELVRMSWDNLYDGMRAGKYDAVLSTLPPYEYNLAKYDFSENLLDLGPVLIVPYGSTQDDLKKLGGDLVGIVANDPAELILTEYPTIIIRPYPSIPELLDALAKGDLQGALLDHIPAVNYIGDLYSGVLQIAGNPLNKRGIHLVGPKGSINAFNKHLHSLRRKSTLEKLKKKWELVVLNENS